MKVNYVLNDDSTIQCITIMPFNENLPTIEIDDNYEIKLGLDKIVKKKLVKFTGIDPKLQQVQNWTRVVELKKLLADTDYKVTKYLEGVISEEDYAVIKSQRQAWRDEINQLEAAE